MALYEFLEANRGEILQLASRNIAATKATRTERELLGSLPELLDDIVAALRAERGLPRETPASEPDKSAGVHGRQRLRLGFTIPELVDDYGAMCTAITMLAERAESIAAHEYQVLNRTIDAAIAAAVTEYANLRDLEHGRARDRRSAERLGFVAHELRNALSSAMLSFDAIRRGHVGVGGRTSDVLERSLTRMQMLIDRSLAEVRIKSGAKLALEPTRLRDVLEDVEISAAPDAQARGSKVAIDVDRDHHIAADRTLLTSALANLVQNAIKYSPAGAEIRVRCTAGDGTLIIEVEDQCGGLPPGKIDALFDPFVRGTAEHGGVGLGLAITRQAIEAHGGRIRVRNMPGEGCVFVVELPITAPATATRRA